MIPEHWQPVARKDGETVGYVAASGDAFVALDLLGHELGSSERDDEARALVVRHGLASLTRSWDWTEEGETRRVYVVHVRPGTATVSTGMPGVIGAEGERFEVALPIDPRRFRPA